MCRFLHFWLTVVNPLHLGVGRACRINVAPPPPPVREDKAGMDGALEGVLGAFPETFSESLTLGHQAMGNSADETESLVACTDEELEEVESYLDLLPVSEREMASLDLDWTSTREDLDLDQEADQDKGFHSDGEASTLGCRSSLDFHSCAESLNRLASDSDAEYDMNSEFGSRTSISEENISSSTIFASKEINVPKQSLKTGDILNRKGKKSYWRIPSLQFSWKLSTKASKKKKKQKKHKTAKEPTSSSEEDNNINLAVNLNLQESSFATPLCTTKTCRHRSRTVSLGSDASWEPLDRETLNQQDTLTNAKDEPRTSTLNNCRIICLPKNRSSKSKIETVKQVLEKRRRRQAEGKNDAKQEVEEEEEEKSETLKEVGDKETQTEELLQSQLSNAFLGLQLLSDDVKDRLPSLQQPAFLGLQLVDWLVTALNGGEGPMEKPLSRETDAQPNQMGSDPDATQNQMARDTEAHWKLVTQICTLLLAIGTLRPTEELHHHHGNNLVFKGESMYTWNLPSPPQLIQNIDGTMSEEDQLSKEGLKSAGLCSQCVTSHNTLIEEIKDQHQNALQGMKYDHLRTLDEIKDEHMQQLAHLQHHLSTLKKEIGHYRYMIGLESLLFMFMILLYAEKKKGETFTDQISTLIQNVSSSYTQPPDFSPNKRESETKTKSTQTETTHKTKETIDTLIDVRPSIGGNSHIPIPPPLPPPPNMEEKEATPPSFRVAPPAPPMLPPVPPPLPPPANLPPKSRKLLVREHVTPPRSMVFSAATLHDAKEGLEKVEEAPSLSMMKSPTNKNAPFSFPDVTLEAQQGTDACNKLNEKLPSPFHTPSKPEPDPLTPPNTPESEKQVLGSSPQNDKNGVVVLPPPPLPPIPFGSPVPPPPPPLPPALRLGGASPGEVEKSLRKNVIIPANPLKSLYWNRIQVYGPNQLVAEKRKGSIWVNLKEPELDVKEIETLFEKVEIKKSQSKSGGPQQSRSARLLDSKRSLSVGVLISSAHIRACDVYDAVIHWDTTVVELDAIKNLFFNQLTPKELLMIKIHKESFQHIPLDKPEQFLWEMTKIHEFGNRAFCMIFQQKFHESISAIEEKLDNILTLCKSILDSTDIRTLFGIILAAGNYLNGGSRTRGQADGFGIDILPKLGDLKARDGSQTLLHFVVHQYKQLKNQEVLKERKKRGENTETDDLKEMVDKSGNPVSALLHHVKKGGNLATFRRIFDADDSKDAKAPSLSFPLPPVSRFKTAVQVNYETVKTDLEKIHRDLEKCDHKAGKVIASADETNREPFNEIMSNFIRNSYQRIANQRDLLTRSIRAFKDLCDYLCFKPMVPNCGEAQKADEDENCTTGLPPPKDIFSIWIDFSEDFQQVWDETSEDGKKRKSPKKSRKGAMLQPNPKKCWQMADGKTSSTSKSL